jgi:two-component system, NtrC family, response regulator HydG
MKKKEIYQYYEKIINTMAEGLIVISSEGTILMINHSFEQMFGYRSEEIVGKSCDLLECDVCEFKGQGGNKPWCRLFDLGRDIKKRCLVKGKNGSYRPVLKKASILKDDSGKAIGAVEILTDISEIDQLDQKVDLLSKQLSEEGQFFGIIGKSPSLKKVFDIMIKAAQSDAPIIIYGESGTGKELVAQAIHQLGVRKDKPFVQLNCAALNESLLESELFGHMKGAFTGAYRHRIGRFEAANGGDIFLDEIGDVPLSIQVKLLRVLEVNKIERVGDHQSIPVDVRLITATNRDLNQLINDNLFREDFYFRINVIPIKIPPLRDRQEDIPLLVNSFVHRLRDRTGKPITGLDHDSLELFLKYQWPGNVRELKSALEYAFVIAEEGLINLCHLPTSMTEKELPMIDTAAIPNGNMPSEKNELIQALRQSKGNQTKAAKILGIARVTVWNRMKKYGIELNKVIGNE